MAPFTKLHVSIRAFTYWGTSPQIRANVYSPASTPSVPRNLRAYVTHSHNVSNDNNVTITVRWDPPLYPNGVINGYKVHCWYLQDSDRIDLCDDVVKDAKDLQIELKSLNQGPIYHFNVSQSSPRFPVLIHLPGPSVQRSPGWRLIVHDFSQLEQRIAASTSPDCLFGLHLHPRHRFQHQPVASSRHHHSD